MFGPPRSGKSFLLRLVARHHACNKRAVVFVDFTVLSSQYSTEFASRATAAKLHDAILQITHGQYGIVSPTAVLFHIVESAVHTLRFYSATDREKIITALEKAIAPARSAGIKLRQDLFVHCLCEIVQACASSTAGAPVWILDEFDQTMIWIFDYHQSINTGKISAYSFAEILQLQMPTCTYRSSVSIDISHRLLLV